MNRGEEPFDAVERIRTHALRLPLRGQLRWGRDGRLDALDLVLVRIDAASGAWGVAEAPVRPTIYGETATGIQALVRDVLAPRLRGKDANDDATLRAVTGSIPFNHTARAALEVAVHDLRARRSGLTLLARHRGPRERVRVSAIVGMDAPAAVAAEVLRIAEAGVRVFKVKVGRDQRRDDAVLAALSEALRGSEAVLYADANELLAPEQAPRRLERMASFGVRWVEEPLPVHMVHERAALKRDGILPIIADDSCFALPDLKRELALDTFDVLNVKPARSGLRDSREMLALARAHGKGAMVGSQAGSGLGTLLAATIASQPEVDHPSELTFPLRLEHDTTEHTWRFGGGELRLDELLSVDLREDLREAFEPLG